MSNSYSLRLILLLFTFSLGTPLNMALACLGCQGGGSDGGGSEEEINFINFAHTIYFELATQKTAIEQILKLSIETYKETIDSLSVECATEKKLIKLRKLKKKAWFTSEKNTQSPDGEILIDCAYWKKIKTPTNKQKQLIFHEYMRKAVGETSAYQLSSKLNMIFPISKNPKSCGFYQQQILPRLYKDFEIYSKCHKNTLLFLERANHWPYESEEEKTTFVTKIKERHQKILSIMKTFPMRVDGFLQERLPSEPQTKSWRELLMLNFYRPKSDHWVYNYSDMSNAKFFFLRDTTQKENDWVSNPSPQYDLSDEITYRFDLSDPEKPSKEFRICSYYGTDSLGYCTMDFKNVSFGTDTKVFSNKLDTTKTGFFLEVHNRRENREIFAKAYGCNYEDIEVSQFHNTEKQHWLSVFGGWPVLTFEEWLNLKVQAESQSLFAPNEAENFQQCHASQSHIKPNS